MGINTGQLLYNSMKQKFDSYTPATSTMRCKSNGNGESPGSSVETTVELRQGILQLNSLSRLDTTFTQNICYFQKSGDQWIGVCSTAQGKTETASMVRFGQPFTTKVINVTEICVANPSNELNKLLKGERK